MRLADLYGLKEAPLELVARRPAKTTTVSAPTARLHLGPHQTGDMAISAPTTQPAIAYRPPIATGS